MNTHRPGGCARYRAIALTPALAERFWSKVDKSGGPAKCWPWKGARLPTGYGILGAPRPIKGTWYAHRVSYALNCGDPSGLHVCHRCDNPQCVNPLHLFLGTAKENAADMIAKGRKGRKGSRRRTVFEPIGFARGEAMPTHKLTGDAVVAIRRRSDAGETSAALGREFGVTETAVRHIVQRKSWRHID